MAGLLNERWGHRGRGSPYRGEGHCLHQREGVGEGGEMPWLLSSSWRIISVFHWLKPERNVELERKRGTSLKITWSLEALMPYMLEAS